MYFSRRATRAQMTAWLISANFHLALLIVVTVALLPALGLRRQPMEIEVTIETEEDLEIFDPDLGALEIGSDILEVEDSLGAESQDLAGEEIELVNLNFSETGLPSEDKAKADATARTSPSAAAPRAAGEAAGREQQGANFFGTQAYGDRFVYILDISGSMNNKDADPQLGTRYTRASRELMRSVEALGEDQAFFVVLFSHTTKTMFDRWSKSPEWLPATDENKAELEKWLTSIRPVGDTDPREALRLGLTLNPSAVFFLTDGEFDRNPKQQYKRHFGTDNPKVEEVIENTPTEKDVPIHTFAYEDLRNRKRMALLASQTGGRSIFVPHNSEVPTELSSGRHGTRRKVAPNARAQALVRIGKSLEEIRKFDGAKKRYAEVLKLYPDTDSAVVARERLRFLDENWDLLR